MINKRKLRILIILIVILISSIVYVSVQNNWIEVEHLTVTIEDLPEELNGITIIQISDLHLPKNASSIDKLVSLIRAGAPDIILMTGDIIDGAAKVAECGLGELLEELILIAPTFSVCGNHETRSGKVNTVNQLMVSKGVTVLNNEYHIHTHNDKEILIIGMYDEITYNSNNFADIDNYSDLPVIMLAHRPELQWSYCSSDNSVIPDLVFSGHAHGGQIRIPYVGGLVAPDQGFFPEYDNGLYVLDNNCRMFVSRGLGNSIIPFRINNRPHLPIITIGN